MYHHCHQCCYLCMLIFRKLSMHYNSFEQSTHHSTITKQSNLPDLIQTSVNDALLLNLYTGCENDVSAITSRNNDTFHELTFIYFMVRVNGFCHQTMEQSDKDTRCPDEKGIEEISSIKFEEIHGNLTTQIMSIIFYLKYVTYSLFFALWLWKAALLHTQR